MTKQQPKQDVAQERDREQVQRDCYAEISDVLRKHRCRIVPALTAEPVGQDGSRAMVSATFYVLAE